MPETKVTYFMSSPKAGLMANETATTTLESRSSHTQNAEKSYSHLEKPS